MKKTDHLMDKEVRQGIGVYVQRMPILESCSIRSGVSDAALERTFIWDQRHLLHALREFESFYNGHRPHRALHQAAPLRPLPEPITEPGQIKHLEIHRQDRLGGTLHEYQLAA
jgi:hypothetical protein